jgi:hypothetical protein
MNKNRLIELFESFDPVIKNIILGVLDIEQEHISKKNPHVKEPINEIVTSAAKKEMLIVEGQERT